MVIAHPIVLEVVEDHLPDYRALRERFPLWTYSRHRPPNRLTIGPDLTEQEQGRLCWKDSRAWFERLRWSQRSPYFSVVAALDRAVKQSGLVAMGGLERPQQETVVVHHPTKGPCEVRVPLELRARTLAIFAAMDSPEIPARAAEIRLPDRWSWYWLDDTDVEQLGEKVARVLCYWSVTEAEQEEFKLPPQAPLLYYFMKLAHQQQDGTADSGALRKRGQRLAELLLRQVGLLLGDRTGGRKTDLEGKFIRCLREEAHELVNEVRDYHPATERLQLHDRLLEARGGKPTSGVRLLQQERARRGGDPPLGLLILRFPFLTPGELDRMRKRDEDRWAEPAGTLADDLLNGRLTANLSRRTIRRRVADAPKSLFEELFPTS